MHFKDHLLAVCTTRNEAGAGRLGDRATRKKQDLLRACVGSGHIVCGKTWREPLDKKCSNDSFRKENSCVTLETTVIQGRPQENLSSLQLFFLVHVCVRRRRFARVI